MSTKIMEKDRELDSVQGTKKLTENDGIALTEDELGEVTGGNILRRYPKLTRSLSTKKAAPVEESPCGTPMEDSLPVES